MAIAEPIDLLPLAESVADGSAIDWDAVEAGTSEDKRGIVRQLRVLSELASLHPSPPDPEQTHDATARRGATLEERLRAQGPFSAREAVLVGIDLCRALAAIHAAGLLHRDVKAQNVMREAGGRIVLMDLGTGREIDRSLSSDMAGTPLYLAPELLVAGIASERTDLYGLGVLLYHLVTGAFPVRGASVDELRTAHAKGLVVRLRDARADLPTA